MKVVQKWVKQFRNSETLSKKLAFERFYNPTLQRLNQKNDFERLYLPKKLDRIVSIWNNKSNTKNRYDWQRDGETGRMMWSSLPSPGNKG